ncbi:hypothetical protein DQ04_06511060 [Trypanosoma grayi]|uniref:hypothetical protein n=1 Tax=Trypanosoma grayi TaxID=71804 RepID=UPI0004F4A100|nr:hypothetical protein DQ04_06511060 [Trypanosoma grayi]KEG08752.1 hypothetical protein DQ04_06511060 [Trypanosoma grayi]
MGMVVWLFAAGLYRGFGWVWSEDFSPLRVRRAAAAVLLPRLLLTCTTQVNAAPSLGYGVSLFLCLSLSLSLFCPSGLCACSRRQRSTAGVVRRLWAAGAQRGERRTFPQGRQRLAKGGAPLRVCVAASGPRCRSTIIFP